MFILKVEGMLHLCTAFATLT